jgi:hypothetical protein
MGAQIKAQSSHGKAKKIILMLCIILIVVLVPTVSAAAYAGFVPGVTELMKMNKPVDLGVRYSVADFKQIQTSTNSLALNVGNFSGPANDITGVSPGKNLVVYGANTTQFTLTQEELTAFINMVPWTGSPLSNSQIRLEANGVFEFSGNVNAAYISSLIKTLYPSSDLGRLSFVARLASYLQNPAVYIKGQLSSTGTGDPNHGNLNFKVLALKVNRTDLSTRVSDINEVNVPIGHGSNAQGIPYSVSSLTISNGQLSYYGNAPADLGVGNSNPDQICSNYHGGSLLSLSNVGGRIGSILKYCN